MPARLFPYRRLAHLSVVLLIIAFAFAACAASGVGTTTPGAQSIAQATHTPTHAATRTPTPKPTATPQPAPTDTPVPPPPAPTCIPGAVNCNPYGYNFEPGNLIYNPPGNFCTYFNCIASFWDGRGYVIQCVDGTFSKSGGIQGSCSHHGGNSRPLYSH
jgi:hypothetical protein